MYTHRELVSGAPWLMLAIVTSLPSGCRLTHREEGPPPCEDGRCPSGYACNPFIGQCVTPLQTDSARPDGLCPSRVSAGDTCEPKGTFLPCFDTVSDCSHGCRLCDADGTWSACQSTDCELGKVNTCSTCADDCRARVANAGATCQPHKGTFLCDYGACTEGFADADGARDNGCECQLRCNGLCGGPDGCGSTCPDTCLSPAVCGGNADLPNVCSCTPETESAFCARLGKNCGTVMAPDVCRTTRSVPCGQCSAPETCGDGIWGPANVCGCAPESDAALCTRLGVCGTYQGTDNCEQPRSVECSTAACTAPATCGGGGTPNACGFWWPCDWPWRRQVTVTAGSSGAPAGYSIKLQLDHYALVAAGRSLPSGDDARVAWWNGASWQELDRVLEPESQWNDSATQIWVALPVGLGQSSSLPWLYLYYGNMSPGAPPADERNVFRFADFFDRPADSTWTFVTTPAPSGTQLSVSITGGNLFFAEPGNAIQRPLARTDFTEITGGVSFRFAMNWTRKPGESEYWVDMQLGDADVMTDPLTSDASTPKVGVGPALEWGVYNATDHQRLAANGGLSMSTGQYSGRHVVEARIDATAKDYDFYADGAKLNGSGRIPFFGTGTNAATKLNRVRFSTNGVTKANVDGRTFEYVIIRQLIDAEPMVVVSGEEGGSCP